MTNLIKDLLQNKYSLGSKVREKISPLFYSYGLNCSRHPYLLIALSFSLFCFCFYPIFGIHLFKNDFSQQFVTDLNTFRYCNNLSDDGSPANSNSTYANITSLKEKLRKAPQWFYDRKPHAYVMQIIVQSAVIPWKENLIIMDAIRAPIAQVFSVVDIISNFKHQTEENSTTLNDVCLQIAEPVMLKDQSAYAYMPKYSCLALSPANLWRNDIERFLRDPVIIESMFDIKDTSSLESGSLKELLFGLPWIQTGIRKLYVRTRQRTINYAITLVFKRYDEPFIEGLKQELKREFPAHPFKCDTHNRSSIADSSEFSETVHLYFQNRKQFTEFLLLAFFYLLALVILYFSVRKIDFIKNKFTVAFCALLTIVMSLFSAIGVCFWLQFNPTLNGSDILPYLVLFVGFENVAVLIKSVSSTQYHLDTEVRIAQALGNEAVSILKWFFGLLLLFLLGFLTFIPLIQDLCLFVIVALVSDLVLQLMFFAPILAVNMMKTTKNPKSTGHKRNLSASRPVQWTLMNSNSEMNLELDDAQSPTNVYSRPTAIPEQPVKLPKRLRLFFYCIFDYRIIHIVMGVAFVSWMLLLIPSAGNLKLNSTSRIRLPDDHNRSAAWNDPVSGSRDRLNFEKRKFSKNKFMISHFLSSQHWSTLFWSYNISLSGKYITILPALQLSIPVEPKKAIQTRHPSEPDPQIFRQYLFKQSSHWDDYDDYQDELTYPEIKQWWRLSQWSKRSIMLVSVLLFILTCILICLLVSLYRCLCSRDYADWRSSWFEKSKSDGKNLEELVTETLPIKFRAHDQEIEYLCANTSDGIVVTSDLVGNVKVWNIFSGDKKFFIQRLNRSDKVVASRTVRDSQQTSGGSSSLGSDTSRSLSPSNEPDAEGSDGVPNRSTSNSLTRRRKPNSFSVDRSIGQSAGQSKAEPKKPENDGYDFEPYYNRANISNALISKAVLDGERNKSSDKIHSYDDPTSHANRTLTSALRHQPIWCMTRCDKHLFLGCANGRFEVWNIDKGLLSFWNEPAEPDAAGITSIAVNGQQLAIGRLKGCIEIWELDLKPGFEVNDGMRNRLPRNQQLPTSSGLAESMTSQDYITFRQLEPIRAHKQPVSCMKMNSKYLVTGSLDHKVRVFKLSQSSCSSEYTLHGHFAGITCLEIDMPIQPNSLVSGCKAGQICVWDFSTGACTFNLEAHNGSITEILVTSLYILSSSVDSKINIWDKFSGNLVNEIDYEYLLCHKMAIMESNILVTANHNELHLWSINEAKKIKVVQISEDKLSLIRNLALTQGLQAHQQSRQSAIVCDYGLHLCLIHFPQIKKFD